MTNEEMTAQLLKLPPKDIMELIGMVGMVAVITKATELQRLEMGLTLFSFGQKALVDGGCNVTSTIVSGTGLTIRYKNGVQLD